MKIRLITGASYVAVLAVFYLLKIFVSDLCFDVLIWLFSLIGTFEMLRAFGVFDASELRDKTDGAAEETAIGAKVTKAQAAGVFAFAAVCVPACALMQQYFSAGAFAVAAAFFLLALYLLALLPARHTETGIENTGMAFFAAVYPTLLLALLCLTNHLNAAGAEKYAFDSNLAVLFVFVISPFADSLAYVFGRFLKKKFPKKMAPAVSPNKTVVGGIGGLVGGLIGAAILYFAYNAVAGSFDNAALFLPLYLAVGLIAAAATEFGDLVESCVKRKAGIKDMGRLLPGHGGVMDRIDGTLFAAAAVYAAFAVVSFVA
ncbi:MAG: phosphatidate cytidylyltransferase [Candidatus Scatosoma sp.]